MANNLKKVSSFTIFDPTTREATYNDLLYYVNKTPVGYDSYAISMNNLFLSTDKVQNVKFSSNTFVLSSGSLNLNGSLSVTSSSSFGSIQSTPIGSSTPSTGTFTDLTANNIYVLNSFSSNNVSLTGTLLESSDSRLKTDISKIENALDKIEQLNGYVFTKNGQRLTGVIAQEVQEVLPEAVLEDPSTSYLSVSYGNLAGILIEGIKELRKQIEELKNK